MLRDLKSFVECANSKKRYPQHTLFEWSDDLPVRRHERHLGLLYGGRNLGNILHEIGPPNPAKPGYPLPFLRGPYKTQFKRLDGVEVELTEDGISFELPPDPVGRPRQNFGVADNVEDILAYFAPEAEDPSRSYVVGIVQIQTLRREDGPHITRLVWPGESVDLIQFHLYELDATLFKKEGT